MQKYGLIRSGIYPALFLILLWFIKIGEFYLHQDWYSWGILPRSISGLKGILFSPLIHGSFNHLLSNSGPLIILLTAIVYFYKKIALKIFLFSYLFVGLWVWVLARESYHIGASGLIYSFFGFLLFIGILRKQKAMLAISLITILFYGSLIWGVLPQSPHVSWESHLFGFFTGIILAYYFKENKSPFEKDNPIINDDQKYKNDFWNDVIEK